MAQIIRLKRTSVAGSVPTTSDLSTGELAINVFDGKVFSDADDIFSIIPNETDLKALIQLGPNSGFTEEHLKIILYNTLCALKFLHSVNIIHRDIKPSNILIN